MLCLTSAIPAGNASCLTASVTCRGTSRNCAAKALGQKQKINALDNGYHLRMKQWAPPSPVTLGCQLLYVARTSSGGGGGDAVVAYLDLASYYDAINRTGIELAVNNFLNNSQNVC